MQTWSKFTTLFILRFKKKSMACTEKIAIPSSDPNHVVQIPLSLKVTEGYLKKTSTIGIDAVLIDRKPLEPGCLPQVESIDLLCYLVIETSFYTQKQFKAFRRLEANNQMVSGFVYNAEGHIIANKFVVLAKVRHSQRTSDILVRIWIIIAKEGTINCPHCLDGMQGRPCRIRPTLSQCAILP